MTKFKKQIGTKKTNDWWIPADPELKDRPLYLLTLEPILEQTSMMKKEFENIVLKYKEIIADDTKSLGRTHLIEHTIDLVHLFPIQTKGKPLDLPTMQWLKREVEDILRRGIIRPSNSLYATRISIATKKDGSLRFCYAAIGLNDAIIDDLYTIPNITELMDSLAGFEYCSITDLASGFWQIPVAEKDRYKTAFRTPWGLYEFNVMPFGLKNAPATFQRLMIRVLGQYLYDFVIVYIDDILIYSKSKEEHKRHLHLVFQALRKAGLKIKLKKCEFGKKELKYLGFIIDKRGRRPDPEKVTAIQKVKPPTNITGIRGFMGLAGFYQMFIPKFSTKAAPISKLLSPKEPFKWGIEQAQAFRKLKEALITASVLAHPDFSKPFLLYTDASRIGIAAVLSQKGDDNKVHLVHYASKKLIPAEANYPITDLKGLAVVWVIKKFRSYLRLKLFTIITDHSALKYILEGKEIPEGRRGRWMWYLQQFQFKVQHRSGTRIGHVDYLSREPTGAPEPLEEVFHEEKITNTPKFIMVIIYNYYGIFMSVRTRKVMYGLYQSVCGKTEEKSALQTCMEELWEETRIRILSNRLMWICHDHYFSCDVFELELTEEEEPQWVEKDKHGPWTIFLWDLYLEAVAKGWTTPTHQTHLKEICEVLDIPVKHVS